MQPVVYLAQLCTCSDEDKFLATLPVLKYANTVKDRKLTFRAGLRLGGGSPIQYALIRTGLWAQLTISCSLVMCCISMVILLRGSLINNKLLQHPPLRLSTMQYRTSVGIDWASFYQQVCARRFPHTDIRGQSKSYVHGQQPGCQPEMQTHGPSLPNDTRLQQ